MVTQDPNPAQVNGSSTLVAPCAKPKPKWLSKQSSDPYAVPLAGGCFQAFHRTFFYEIGGYDSGMTNFGSEDLEMCLRVWLPGKDCPAG